MSDYFERIERQLVERVHAGQPRTGFGTPRWRGGVVPLRIGRLAPLAATVLVLAVIGLFLGLRGHGERGAPAAGSPARLVFVASSTTGPVASSLPYAAHVLGLRLRGFVRDATVRVAGDEIVVEAPHASRGEPDEIEALAVPGVLSVYDWEASALTSNGSTVAAALKRHEPAAMTISQGSATFPGTADSGGMSPYAAVRLAAAQRAVAQPHNTHLRPVYYLFGAPGTSACAVAARDAQQVPAVAVPCLLAGPASARAALLHDLPPGVREARGEALRVPPGITVVQAIGAARSESDPRARFFVLRNVVRLTNAAITAPRLSSDTSGAPDVRFGFTRAGGARFQRLTAAIARRGDLVSGLGQTLDQHFAFVLDGRLLAVDSIDYKSYPDGISGSSGAEITGSFTAQSARTFAALLRWGPLPVTLMLR